jgi:hypothetical protein
MSQDNKALVQRWFGLGLSTAEALKLVDRDVKWHLPETVAVALTGDPGPAIGHQGIRWVTRMSDAVYAERRPSEVDFVIAEGDWVVMQMTVTSRLHTGDYRNRYVFTIRCAKGLVLALSPPDVLDQLLQRIAASSAADEI